MYKTHVAMLIEFPPPLWIMLDESHAVDAADGPS